MPDAKPLALVIDDDPELNSLIGAYADLSGLEYCSAETGLGGLAEIARHVPDVVVLDVMLPDMDGFEVCRRIRSDAKNNDLPVIMLTALCDPQSRERGRAAGATEYLSKPFEPDRLMQLLRDHSSPDAARR